MTLTGLIGQYVRHNWRPYLLSAMMLASVSALTVFIPRQVGHVVDGLVQGTLGEDALLAQLAWLVLAGIAIYFLRVAWRLQLFAASYRLGAQLRQRLYARLCQQGPHFFQQKRTGDLMALATNDIDSVEMASGEAMLAGFDGTLTLIMVVALTDQAQNWRTGFIPFDAYLTAQNGSLFPLFPWAGFAIAGFLTSSFKEYPRRLAFFGVALSLGADALPWIDSTTAFFLERLGWVTVIATGVRLLISHWFERVRPLFGWVELAGKESLTLYVVHLALIHAIPFPSSSLHLRIGPTLSVWMTTLLFVILLLVSLGFVHLKAKCKRPTAT